MIQPDPLGAQLLNAYNDAHNKCWNQTTALFGNIATGENATIVPDNDNLAELERLRQEEEQAYKAWWEHLTRP